MKQDLLHYIQTAPLADTHEHQPSNAEFLSQRLDILQLIGANYLGADLVSADPTLPAHQWGLDLGAPEVHPDHSGFEERYRRMEPALKRIRYTSYGRAKLEMGRKLWGIEDFSLESLHIAQAQLEKMYQNGQRMSLFREHAGLDHIQIDNARLTFELDDEDPEYCLHDIRVIGYVSGRLYQSYDFTPEAMERIGVDIVDLSSLEASIVSLFEQYGPIAVATKMPHAYERTLHWRKRSTPEARASLERVLRDAADAAEEDRLCVGDWCTSRIIEQSIRHQLPIKIHTGYNAGNNQMRMDFIRPSLLNDLILEYPEARFVLMHIGYPYEKEIIALAKHFPNVWVDMCWAWSISEVASVNFVREFLNAVPYNKLFAFGGDIMDPFQVVGFAQQARDGLNRALQANIEAGYLDERGGLEIAEQVMLKNAYEVFDLEGTRENIRSAVS